MSDELLAGYPVVVRIPVQWGEMNAYGHVATWFSSAT